RGRGRGGRSRRVSGRGRRVPRQFDWRPWRVSGAMVYSDGQRRHVLRGQPRPLGAGPGHRPDPGQALPARHEGAREEAERIRRRDGHRSGARLRRAIGPARPRRPAGGRSLDLRAAARGRAPALPRTTARPAPTARPEPTAREAPAAPPAEPPARPVAAAPAVPARTATAGPTDSRPGDARKGAAAPVRTAAATPPARQLDPEVVEACCSLYQDRSYAEVISVGEEALGRARTDSLAEDDAHDIAALWSVVALAKQAREDDEGA